MYMRHIFLVLILTIIIAFSIQLPHAASKEEDLQSVIIEVEGDPLEHKKYIKTYHPFVKVVETYDTLFKGLALQAQEKDLEKMESLEFIKNIHGVQTYEAISITEKNADQHAVLPSAINHTGYTGKGVKVGVIDTGIDYTHPDLKKNYQQGYDLVDLDEDPMETLPEEGLPTLHGTHVAGIIAADGELKGVAPNAEIYAYRALGPGGSGTSVQVIAAMERAVKDGVDVMNLSLGNTVNGPDYPTSVAVNRAIELGIAVVIANGNNGPNNWTVGSPATASKALSVGATSAPASIPFLYEPVTNKEIPLLPMIGSLPWGLEKYYPIVNAEDGKDMSGKIALLQRGKIPFYEKAKQAEMAGAIAVLIYNNQEGLFQGMVENENDPLTVPVAAITKKSGQWLIEQMKHGTKGVETIYKETPAAIADFSSRGPVTVNWDIKPDVLAPGTSILSTVPAGYKELQGTSMAAPHVAGAIALLKEAQPDWTVDQLFGALKTTAAHMETEEGESLDPIVQGAGEIRPAEAINTNTIIYNSLLAFGKADGGTTNKEKKLVIENMTNQPKTYSFDIPMKEKGISWNLPLSFTLQGGEKRKVPIKLTISTTQLEEGLHQGWLKLTEDEKTYQLPYLFVNKSADNPKAMGFEFSWKSFSKDMYMYRIYMAEPAKRVKIDLYDPDTLLFDRTILEMEELETGINEGQIRKSAVGKSGQYKALITVYLEDGSITTHETQLQIDEES